MLEADMKTIVWSGLAVALLGCAHTPAATRGARARGSGYELAMSTFSCWLGPVWDDALGEPAPERVASAEQRCRDVAAQVWGDSERTRVERLRALESVAVEDVALKVRARAADMGADEQRALVALFKQVADAERETMYARRAGDRVKIDLADEERPRARLTSDEQAAVAALDRHVAIDSLFRADGPFAADARALAILSAMDRMQTARGLPKHMKAYAVRGVFTLVFQVPPPQMPADPTIALTPGQWLDYLSRVATVAGHPLLDGARTPRERNQLAWGGVLAGFADRLRPELAQLSPRLAPVVRGTVARLDAEYVADRNAIASHGRSGAER
jgi:hypothetical protein